ncbi:MAG: TM0106 family RecB-like putative nuclease [Acidimicrobiales bacterium]
MQVIDGTTIYSASDLTSFLECRHKVGLKLAAAQARAGGDPVTDGADGAYGTDGALGTERADDVDLVARHGLAHEQRHLESLRARGLHVVEAPEPIERSLAGFRAAADATVEIMRAGPDVIFQAVLFDGTWLGYADFLTRVDRPSALGGHSYEARDTKLARSTKISALIQLADYSAHLERLQGAAPETMHVVLGDDTTESVQVRIADAYHRRLRRRFLDAVGTDLRAEYPVPVSHCDICEYAQRCADRRTADDHLSLLPGVRRDQVAKLEEGGYATVAALGTATPPVTVPRLADGTTERLHNLARLQVDARAAGEPLFELKPPSDDGVRTGFDLLPEPNPGDLFFDLEGDPFIGDEGREYLWGWCDDRGEPGYVSAWGHTAQTERDAAVAFIDMVTARLAEHPGMHVYHYASYEITVLKRLTAVHGLRQTELDELLRTEVFCDLYTVARQGLAVSVPSYSIKKLEAFYRAGRNTDVTSGMESVVAYEDWLDTGNQALLDDIEAYNRDDCVSTLELRDWLVSIRPPAAPAEPDPDDDGAEDTEPTDNQLRDERRAALVERLLDGTAATEPGGGGPIDPTVLLAGLLGFHRREARPASWQIFARQNMTDAELVDDSESIGQITYEGPVDTEKQSIIHRYRFDPDQSHKLGAGDKVLDPDTLDGVGAIRALDDTEGTVDFKVGKNRPAPTPRGLIPGWGPPTASLEEALLEIGEWVADNGIATPGPYRAALDLLRRVPPRLGDHTPGAPLVLDDDPSGALPGLAARLDHSHLAVQGPPGSGKTYAGAELICHLVQLGRKVGVTANSHAVIENLLTETCEHADGDIRAIKIGGDHDPEEVDFECAGNHPGTRDDIVSHEGGLVVGGSAWFFSHADMRDVFDVIVIDEAGQLSLANAVAVSTGADSLVLLGDPQQLDQPMQGSHPPGTATSALGHLIGHHDTLPPELGVFLDRTWRMHADVCGPVSELSYDGRLRSRDLCAARRLLDHGTGIRWVPVAHEGCRNESPAEAERVSEIVDALLADGWVNDDGAKVALTAAEILVIAPYNAQVRRLRSVLGERARVGTVDKFQGQQAAVAIFSMAASSAEDIPRGVEFQFSRNRLNVAISRAKCLSIVVGSERLLDARCRNRDQLSLVNALCRLVETAQRLPGGL